MTAIKTENQLFAMVQMKDSQTELDIYNILNELLFTGEGGVERKKKNLIGVATDSASNMISPQDAGLTNRLHNELPHLIVIHDFCHALNLVLKKCIENFPQKYVKIVESICSIFSKSPKQAAILKDKNAKVLQVKRYVDTRWSSFADSLGRILEIKDSLKIYFNRKDKKRQKDYMDPENIVMLLANKVSIYIKVFETENLDLITIVRYLKECAVRFGDYIYKITTPKSEEDFINKDYLFTKIKLYLIIIIIKRMAIKASLPAYYRTIRE